jgi:hypothetical protein
MHGLNHRRVVAPSRNWKDSGFTDGLKAGIFAGVERPLQSRVKVAWCDQNGLMNL